MCGRRRSHDLISKSNKMLTLTQDLVDPAHDPAPASDHDTDPDFTLAQALTLVSHPSAGFR